LVYRGALHCTLTYKHTHKKIKQKKEVVEPTNCATFVGLKGAIYSLCDRGKKTQTKVGHKKNQNQFNSKKK